jgi:hypothetical protein
MRLIKYLSSKSSIEKLTKSGLIVPARIDVAEETFLNDSLKPKNNKVFLAVIKTSKPTPVSADYLKIQEKITEKNNYLFNRE